MGWSTHRWACNQPQAEERLEGGEGGADRVRKFLGDDRET